MALKSYRSRKKGKKKKKRRMFSDLTTGAITAIVGVSLVSETAKAL